jgi:hypothetical protein
MKAISLWQPYASLVAHRLKKNETRGWSTSYRGPVLIHAAKKWTLEQAEELGGFLQFPEVWAAYPQIGATPPLGAILAVARVVDVREMTAEWIDAQAALELAAGDWQEGRFGWVLDDVRTLDTPIPCVGAQGLWDVRRVTEAGAAAYPKRLARELVAADFDRLKAIYDEVARGAAREAGGAL